ncbi:hypothetical protein ACHWQZ_G003322 [Mnemiopsis leidyi]
MGVEVAGFKITEDFKVIGLVREILAEFLGTFYLIFIGCGGVGGAQLLQKVTTKDQLETLFKPSSAVVLQIAFAFGLGIGAAVHLFSDISGGQFNPAVSFGLFFARQLSLVKAALFSVVQLIGGLVAGAILSAMLGWCPGAVGVAVNIGTPSAFFIEFFGTLFLVLTVLSTTNSDRKQAASYLQPLSIGIAIFVLHMFLVPTTGCGLNPARSLVTNIIENKLNLQFLVYIFGPLLASLVGGLLYEFLFSPHYRSEPKSDRSVVYMNNTTS